MKFGAWHPQTLGGHNSKLRSPKAFQELIRGSAVYVGVGHTLREDVFVAETNIIQSMFAHAIHNLL